MGDFLVPRDGGFVLVKGQTGITFVPVGFETQWPQFRPFRQGWAGVTHAEKPANALWLKPEKTFDKPASPDGKQGLYLVDADGKPGDRIEETLYLHALVLPGDGHPPHGASFAFHSTSLNAGKALSERADRVQAVIDGKPLRGYVTGKWKLSSEHKKSGDSFRWYAPVLSLIGRVGEERGPSVAGDAPGRSLTRGQLQAGLGDELGDSGVAGRHDQRATPGHHQRPPSA